MTTITVETRIQAPPEQVFAAVAEPEGFPELVPSTHEVRFLTEQRSGVGTRFIEAREYGGKDRENEVEVVEHEPPRRVRLVTEAHGTTWDSLFEIKEEGEACRLTVTMDAQAESLATRLRNKAISPLLRKTMEEQAEAIKAALEG